MSLKVERQLPLILSAVFIIITVIGFAFYQNAATFQEAVNFEKRSQHVLGKFDEMLRLTSDIEAGSRRFIVLGNESYLKRFTDAKQKIGPTLAELRQVAAGNPVQTAELDRLEPLVNEYVQDAQAKVDKRRTSGFEQETAGLIANRREMELADQIRSSVEKLKREELFVLQNKEASLDRNLYLAIWTLIIGSLAGMAALGIANYVVLREIGKRRLAETALIEANKDLEKRIDERTAELKAANLQLLESSTERETLLNSEKEARREAELANRVRDQFLAMVSHELRSPMNAIVGWARLIKAGKLNETQTAKAVETIILNSEAQNRLIRDLMDIARVISGKLDLQLSDVCPAEVVKLAADSVRPTAEKKEIAVAIDVDAAIQAKTMRGDKTRLLQIFSNILGNAVKFTPEGGSVTVLARGNDEQIEVEVSDTGIGISPEFLPLVFDRFRQDDGVRKSAGLGLGLAIVRNLVERHGGSVNVASDGEGCGATFTVVLPLNNSKEVLSAADSGNAASSVEQVVGDDRG